MKSNVPKPCRDLHWLDNLQFSISRFFKQASTQNSHLLCHLPNIHTLILKICPSFRCSVFTFLRSMTKCAKRKYFAVYPSRVEDDCGLCVEWFNWVLKICPKFQVLVFSHFWSWLSAWYKKCAKKKYFNSKKSPIYVKCDKRFAIKNSGVLVWPWYLTWTIWEWNC